MKKKLIMLACVATIGATAGVMSLPTETERMISLLDNRPHSLSVQETMVIDHLINQNCPGEKSYRGQPTVETVKGFLQGNCHQ